MVTICLTCQSAIFIKRFKEKRRDHQIPFIKQIPDPPKVVVESEQTKPPEDVVVSSEDPPPEPPMVVVESEQPKPPEDDNAIQVGR